MAVTFFKSVERPGLSMNRFGVVFAERSHELADNDLWRGVDWASVPLKNGNLAVKEAVSDEAYAAGYRWAFKGNERVWSKPATVARRARREQTA